MAFQTGTITLISKGTVVVGDIHFSGSLAIEGKVQGNIIADSGSKASITVLDKGLVEGDIHVPSVIVNGRVVGNVFSNKHIELAAKAKVEGNVYYNLIEMVKGSQVNGNFVYSDGAVEDQSTVAVSEGEMA